MIEGFLFVLLFLVSAIFVLKLFNSTKHGKPQQFKKIPKLSEIKELAHSALNPPQQDLLRDPLWRGDHASILHGVLHEKFPDTPAIRLEGEERDVFIVHKFEWCKKIMFDGNFTSNPFPDLRLVALNTMNDSQHNKMIRFIKPGYVANKWKSDGVEERCIERIAEFFGKEFLKNGDAVKFAKRFHMAVSLGVSGLGGKDWLDNLENNPLAEKLIDRFIEFNDAAVRLMAPLGGIGFRSGPGNFSDFLRGVIKAVPSVLRLVWEIGFIQTWKLLRPDLIFLPQKRPFSHIREYPKLLKLIPEYFIILKSQMIKAEEDSPAGGLYKGIVDGKISWAEALVVSVQLMVNMTTANGILNCLDRLVLAADYEKENPLLSCLPALVPLSVPGNSLKVLLDPELSEKVIFEILRVDAPLMRNPRQALKDMELDGVKIPAGSLILLFLGAANVDPENLEFSSLSFGHGMHACLGRYLVLSEIRICWDLFKKWKIWENKLIERERLVHVDVGNYGFSKYRFDMHFPR